MALVFTAAVVQPVFLRGAGVYLTLELFNPGDRAVEMPSRPFTCDYTLIPPGPDDLLGESHPAPLSAPWGEKLSLGPGERWTGVVELDKVFPLKDDGRYQVFVKLRWGDLQFNAAPQEFTIEDFPVGQLSMGSGGLVFLRPQGPKKALMYVPVSWRGSPMDGEPHLGDPYKLLTLPAEARDPVRTSRTASMLLDWSFWRQENLLLGIRGASDHPRELPLPGTVQRLIEPALLDSGSLTHLYALSIRDNIPRLLVVRVMDYLVDPHDRERVLTERTLDALPDATGVMIDEVQGKARRTLVLARMAGPVPRFDWMSYAGDAVPDSLRAHAWTKPIAAERIADSRPEILGLPDGGLKIAWVVRDAGKSTQALLCEATFDASGALQDESMTPLASESPIKAARIAYFEGDRYVALWTEDGKVLAGKGEKLRVVVEKCLNRVPPIFFELRWMPVILDFDPVKGMTLVGAR